MSPNSFDAWEASLLKFLFEETRADHCPITGKLVRSPVWGASKHDGIVSVIDGLDIENGFVTNVTGIVPCPFTEGTFTPSLFRIHKPFENNLRIGWNRKSRHLPMDHRVRFAPQTSCKFIFTYAIRDFVAGHKIEEGVATERNSRWHGLAARHKLVTVDATMLSRRNVKPHSLFVMDHHSISPQVHPALVRILGYVKAPCSDIAPSIPFVPERSWEGEDIYFVPRLEIFQYGSVLYKVIRDRFGFLEGLVELVRELNP
jgi:hypothetical protein